ncbi:diguanylate cyclase [Aquitalea sp. ASV15]|uniref:GGDEF domain-containing protein n=1 Tax=Aquitalea sp. ASV15 TaxID=2795104 RepID=UPI0018EBB278|nr:GGDEF domain-containing protein [Aquitalea sp. ASV15]
MHPWQGRFCHPATERAFQRHQLRHIHTQLCLPLSFGAAFYIAFALTDAAALGYGFHTLQLLLARLVAAITATAGLVLLTRRPHSLSLPASIATVIEVVGVATFLLIVLYRPTEVSRHAMSMTIMLVVLYLFIPNPLLNVAGIALTATLAFLGLIWHLGTLSPSDLVTISTLLLLTNTFGLVATWRYQGPWREEFCAQFRLYALLAHDPLTGYHNRRYLDEQRLQQEIDRAQRYEHWLTVVLCDLDHFKRINGSCGHLAGDDVLQQFGKLLHTTTRGPSDRAVRYGCKEFLLVLSETDLAGAMQLAERQRTTQEVQPLAHPEQRPIMATASFGVVAVNFGEIGNELSQKALIAIADVLLYRAKQAECNCIEALVWAPDGDYIISPEHGQNERERQVCSCLAH